MESKVTIHNLMTMIPYACIGYQRQTQTIYGQTDSSSGGTTNSLRAAGGM